MKDEERIIWTEHINNYKSSGLTAVKWAEANSISIHKLRYCIYKFNKENIKESQEPKEVKWTKVVAESSASDIENSRPLKVTIGKAVIEVNTGFNPDTLKSLIDILSQ